MSEKICAVSFTNTLSGKKEAFVPLQRKEVRMYTCGPTAYDVAHIGNFRAALLPDLITRVLEYLCGHKVTSVTNVTDFGHLAGDAEDTEDKMTLGLRREGKELTLENMVALGKKYGDLYFSDLKQLNISSFEKTPYASEHVKGQITFIKRLIDSGHAYETTDGVYFNVPKATRYGALGRVVFERGESRVEHGEKRDIRDFALWKKNKSLGWESPWGRGFPGWHIECTTMATEYLGETFDIHAGGEDLIAIHHNNEIAQAEAVSHKPYARFWIHNAFVTVHNEKASKSLGNVVVLKEMTDRGFDPLSLRYWFLTGHYRTPLNFTWDALLGAHTALMRARSIVSTASRGWFVSPNKGYMDAFKKAVGDDLDTPEAIAILWKMLRDKNVKPSIKRKTAEEMDKVLGIGLSTPLPEASEEIKKLLHERDALRKKNAYDEADVMRVAIEQKGYDVQDTEKGSVAILVPKT
jgi:cysteinyl-tRNA synthetase